jgi:hypothetical protein
MAAFHPHRPTHVKIEHRLRTSRMPDNPGAICLQNHADQLGPLMMAPSNDTSGSAPIQDSRSAPRGVLPRQLQMWLMIGLAVIILVIILFTGHSSPVPRASAATRTAEPSLMPPDRIQMYQRQLADDEARLRRELAQAPNAPRAAQPPSVDAAGESRATDPIVDG